MMGPTTALRRELENRFVPHMADHGFILDRRRLPVSLTLRRFAAASIHMVDLVWDKYGRPRFSVLCGTCPAEGLRIRGEAFAPENVLSSWLPDAASLHPRRGTSTAAWFRQDSTWWERLFGRRPRLPGEVVDQLLDRLPELEAYWSTGRVGPHMRQWRISTPSDR